MKVEVDEEESDDMAASGSHVQVMKEDELVSSSHSRQKEKDFWKNEFLVCYF